MGAQSQGPLNTPLSVRREGLKNPWQALSGGSKAHIPFTLIFLQM